MKLGTLAGLGLALLSVGCSGISTSTDYDPDFDFSGLDSFYWIDSLGQVDDFISSSIRGSVSAELSAKGFRESKSDPALRVSYQVTTAGSSDTVSGSSGDWGRSGWGRGWDGVGMSTGANSPNVWNEGTLILGIFDSSTKDLVWTGSATTELSALRTREDREEAIDSAVKKLMSDFPPGS